MALVGEAGVGKSRLLREFAPRRTARRTAPGPRRRPSPTCAAPEPGHRRPPAQPPSDRARKTTASASRRRSRRSAMDPASRHRRAALLAFHPPSTTVGRRSTPGAPAPCWRPCRACSWSRCRRGRSAWSSRTCTGPDSGTQSPSTRWWTQVRRAPMLLVTYRPEHRHDRRPRDWYQASASSRSRARRPSGCSTTSSAPGRTSVRIAPAHRSRRGNPFFLEECVRTSSRRACWRPARRLPAGRPTGVIEVPASVHASSPRASIACPREKLCCRRRR